MILHSFVSTVASFLSKSLFLIICDENKTAEGNDVPDSGVVFKIHAHYDLMECKFFSVLLNCFKEVFILIYSSKKNSKYNFLEN